MRGCLNCICGSNRLEPSIYLGDPTLVAIKCIECDKEGKKHISTQGAIIEWNYDIIHARKTKNTP